MKREGKWALLLSVFVVFCMLLLLPPSAPAQEWSCIQGSAGNVEFPSRLVSLDGVHIGWGLDFDQTAATWNWIHFAIPTKAGSMVSRVALQHSTGSSDAVVEIVDVFDLGVRVATFANLGWSGDERIRVLTLDSPMRFNALSLAIQTVTGSTVLSHRFVFNGACALVLP